MRKKYITYNLIMAGLSLIIAIILIIQLTVKLSYKVELFLKIIDCTIWIIFIVDYFVRLYKSKNKKKFIKRNIIDLVAIIPFYSIFRVFKALDILRISRLVRVAEISNIIRILAITRRTNKNLSEFIKTNNFDYILGSATVIIFVGSLIMSYVENISIGDALWWSIVTVTTVGYGDISPKTGLGKTVATVLMIMGIGFIGSLTSTLSTYFIKKEESKYKIQEQELKNCRNCKNSTKTQCLQNKDFIKINKENNIINNYKDNILKDIIKSIENFDELSIEELNTLCGVLKSLKEK